MDQQGFLDCIAFLLIQDHQVLAEKRKLTKKVVPGALTLPAGHMEAGETPEEALRRELREELDICPTSVTYVCTLLHRAQELRKLHYFAVDAWTGEPRPLEADGLEWVHLRNLAAFDCDVDRVAVDQYIRLYWAETAS